MTDLTADDRKGLEGQRVLITGAGGAIGLELARQVAACRPSRLTLFEQSEHGLSRAERAIAERFRGLAVDAVLGDVRRRRSVRGACRGARPHVVYHAAAYSNVAILERAVCAAIEANVLGTVTVARAARDLGSRMMLVSPESAVRPDTVAAATARLAELALFGHACPVFRPAIARLAEVGADASRAAALVIQADLLGHPGRVYWLDTGRKGHGDRPNLERTERQRVWTVGQEDFDARAVHRVLRALRKDVADNDAMSALADLCAAVPAYRPSDLAWRHAAASTVRATPLAMPAGPILSIHHAAVSQAPN